MVIYVKNMTTNGVVIANASSEEIAVKYGKPVLRLDFKKIKIITSILVILLGIDAIFSLKLFVSAIEIRAHIGYFINMVSSGDGDILPSLQAVPVLFFLLLDAAMAFFLYKAFDPISRPNFNRIMFILTVIGAVLLTVVFIVMIAVLVHSYGAHDSLSDGITTAMNNYSDNIKLKMHIDRLQIEFQCCGSKKYDEWYTIQWYDKTLQNKGGESAEADGHTPFSCCSMKSLTPCIHHDIETTGKSYLYTPEFNLSVSTRGCHDLLRERKQAVGWGIVGNLFLILLLQGATVCGFRLIQTGHFPRGRFEGNKAIYTVWIIGMYSGKLKRDKEAPEPPPLPPELMK